MSDVLSRLLLFGLLLTVIGGVGCKMMPNAPRARVAKIPTIGIMNEYKPLSLGKIVVRIPRGQKIGGIYDDLTCYEVASMKWQSSGNLSVDVTQFEDVFREDMNSAGFVVAGDPTNLFQRDGMDENQAEYIVGALIKDADYHLCRPVSAFNEDSIKGWCRVKVNWQFFSALEQRVVHEVTTEGVFDQSERTDTIDGFDLWRNAFSASVQNLMADKGFLKLVSGESVTSEQRVSFENPILMNNRKLSRSSIQSHMEQARDATVLIHVGSGGHGSGFFIDSSGYILTNRHVTGGAKRMTVEMSTGRRLVAEVLRTDTQRDIALLKVEDGVYPALPLDLRDPGIGSEVYAIGAPLRKKLKFTVTRGVLSAYREYKGLTIFQSDVNTQGGNSGGPLLDAKGNVVAVCVIGYLNSSGQNFGANGFIPIKSALERLNIKLKN